MSLRVYLLTAVVIAGLCRGTKSESFISSFKILEECVQKPPWTMNCIDEVCLAKKCLKRWYDLLFKNSSYSLNQDHDVSRAAHCAIDECVQGIMESTDIADGLFSGWMEPILACLFSVSRCVKNNSRDEL